MSRSEDSREGLSPVPNILDLFEDEDDENDDIYEPATEQSDLATTTTEEESETEFAGTDQPLISKGQY